MTALQELREIVLLENTTQRAGRLAGWIRRWTQEFHGVQTVDDLYLSCLEERADGYRQHLDRQTAYAIGKALVENLGATKVEVRRVTADESLFARMGYTYEEHRRTLLVIRAEPR